MLKYLCAALFASSVAHAQNPAEVERLCKHMVDLPEIVEIFRTCEPGEQKKFADTPWKEKVTALMRCLKSGKAPRSIIERQRVAIEFCFSELEE